MPRALTLLLSTIACSALGSATAWAAANAAISLAGGVAYRYDDGARAVTDDDGSFSWTEDWGTHLVLGASAPEKAFIGYPWVDIDWTRSTGNGNRIDSVGVMYVERIPLGQGPYLGLGVGSFYNNIRIEREDYTQRQNNWRIGGRGLAGWNLPAGLFIETGYNLSGKVGGTKTDSVDLSLGIRF
jgi:hypothetical protein